MEKVKIILPKNFKHIVEIMVEGYDDPTIPGQLPVIDPKPPAVKPTFPQVTDIQFIKDAESINRNTLLPFKHGEDNYVLMYNHSKLKTELWLCYESVPVENLLNLDVILDGKEVSGMVQDVFEDKWNRLYAVCEIGNSLHLLEHDGDPSLKRWVSKGIIPIHGANDTHHDVYVNDKGQLVMHGRKRGPIDYPHADDINQDRRAVRTVLPLDNTATGFLSAIEGVPIDPLMHQPGYNTNKIRKDYYGSRSITIKGKDGKKRTFSFINTFHKDSDRPPSTRPDREKTGTGPLYPIVFLKDGNEWIPAFDQHLFDWEPFLRDWPMDECKPYNPEIGQLYISGLKERGDYIEVYFVYRDDPHYLELEGQQPTKLYVGKLDKQALIDWFEAA